MAGGGAFAWCMDEASLLHRHRDEDGVVRLAAANGPLNLLSRSMRQALLAAAQELAGDVGLRAVVLACAGRTFFCGADIAELDRGIEPPGLHEFTSCLDRAPVPWIAALHGSVFGGGVVVACACDWRVAADDARFALPEVGLGLLPTFGGTQMLPRLVGVEAALALAVDGRRWGAAEALATGLVDEVVAPHELQAAAAAAARRGLPKRRWCDLTRHSDDAAAAARAFERRREALCRPRAEALCGPRAVADDALAARRCLDVMQHGLTLPLHEALAVEHAAFLELLASPESACLRQQFFAARASRRVHPSS